ncbi:unnamed protein product [Closterium sp. Yama58-4]|nr:unnamed protein product [Closterium sp. Yama58-4]
MAAACEGRRALSCEGRAGAAPREEISQPMAGQSAAALARGALGGRRRAQDRGALPLSPSWSLLEPASPVSSSLKAPAADAEAAATAAAAAATAAEAAAATAAAAAAAATAAETATTAEASARVAHVMSPPPAAASHWFRPAFVLFGDSLTQRSFAGGGWGAALQNLYARKVNPLLQGALEHNRNEQSAVLLHSFPFPCLQVYGSRGCDGVTAIDGVHATMQVATHSDFKHNALPSRHSVLLLSCCCPVAVLLLSCYCAFAVLLLCCCCAVCRRAWCYWDTAVEGGRGVTGLSGYNTRWALFLLPKLFPKGDTSIPPPALVTVFFGANDAALPGRTSGKQHVPIPEFKENLRVIVTHLQSEQQRHAQHVLILEFKENLRVTVTHLQSLGPNVRARCSSLFPLCVVLSSPSPSFLLSPLLTPPPYRQSLGPNVRVVLITPPPVDEPGRMEFAKATYGEQCMKEPERTNEVTGKYAAAVKEVAEACGGVPAARYLVSAAMSTPNKRREMDVMKLMMSDYKVELINDSMIEFNVYFHGPKESPYEGGVWKVHVELPDAYPYKSPSIGFINRIFHPNVDESSGSVCLDVINQIWSPMFDLINVFEVFLPQLLLYPNPTDPLNGEAAAMLMRDPEQYKQKVKEYCLRYGKAEDLVRKHKADSDDDDSEDLSDYDDNDASSDEEMAGPTDL